MKFSIFFLCLIKSFHFSCKILFQSGSFFIYCIFYKFSLRFYNIWIEHFSFNFITTFNKYIMAASSTDKIENRTISITNIITTWLVRVCIIRIFKIWKIKEFKFCFVITKSYIFIFIWQFICILQIPISFSTTIFVFCIFFSVMEFFICLGEKFIEFFQSVNFIFNRKCRTFAPV